MHSRKGQGSFRSRDILSNQVLRRDLIMRCAALLLEQIVFIQFQVVPLVETSQRDKIRVYWQLFCALASYQ